MTAPWFCGVVFLELDKVDRATLTRYLQQRYSAKVETHQSAQQADIAISVLETPAYLHSSFQESSALVLKLLTQEQVIEMRIEGARLVSSNLRSRLVSVIASDPRDESNVRTFLLDGEGTSLLELEGGLPEITCRQAKLHDFG